MTPAKTNVYYELPRAQAIFVKAPGESEKHLASLTQENQDTVTVNFPQCPLVPERVPSLQAVEVPNSWISYPEEREAPAPDLTKNPQIRPEFEAFLAQTGGGHLNLRKNDWEVLEAANPSYNCIANTLSAKHELPGFGFHDFTFDVKDYAALYLKNGFLPLGDLDYSYDPSVEKVVLYGLGPSNPGYWDTCRGAIGNVPIHDRSLLVTHGARQEENGLYSSKFGDRELIATRSPEHVAGECYGQPIAVFARIRPQGDGE